MTDNLKNIELRYQELEARLAANETYSDPELVSRLNREQRELEPLVSAYRALCRARSDLAGAEELLGDPEMKELAQQELVRARQDVERLEREVKVLLLPRDPNDGKNVIMEIRAGVGGEESALFANSLTRMYTMYAERRGWRVEVNSASETELGGVKEMELAPGGVGRRVVVRFGCGCAGGRGGGWGAPPAPRRRPRRRGQTGPRPAWEPSPSWGTAPP